MKKLSIILLLLLGLLLNGHAVLADEDDVPLPTENKPQI